MILDLQLYSREHVYKSFFDSVSMVVYYKSHLIWRNWSNMDTSYRTSIKLCQLACYLLKNIESSPAVSSFYICYRPSFGVFLGYCYPCLGS